MATLANILAIIAPKKKTKAAGTGQTGTYNAQNPETVLTLPTYREHLTDIFTSRQANDSRTLLKDLFKTDPDVSAAVNSYLTLADTPPIILVRDLEGQIDRDAMKTLNQMIKNLTVPTDYTQGFQMKANLRTLTENFRYMVLLRGSLGTELVYNKELKPSELRNVDTASLRWYEKTPGVYKPAQLPTGSNTEISLDIPTFFVAHFRRDPTTIYSQGHFVSAINTIAARQQVINDLYRIMRVTGYPRMDIKVVEEVLIQNAPASVKADAALLKVWLRERLNEVASLFANVRPDQAFTHFDSVEATIINDKNPGVGIDVKEVIETLNSQNQAGLKTMATVIGRGQQGAGVATIEARIAAMNADQLNAPIAEILSNVFSFMLHQTGYQGFAEVTFQPVELRAAAELEPQLVLRSSRLLTDLSRGLITDDEYHLWMYGRIRPDEAPELSGTNFMVEESIDASKASPNADPMGAALTPKGGKAAKGNAVKTKSSSKSKK
jgi:hypothetical protein